MYDPWSLIPSTVIPVIHAGVALVTVNEGDTAVLDCNATGNPPPTVSWFHSSLPIPEAGDTRIHQTVNGSLIVTSVRGGDEGEYVCQATNVAGSETATLVLVVNGEWRSVHREGCGALLNLEFYSIAILSMHVCACAHLCVCDLFLSASLFLPVSFPPIS